MQTYDSSELLSSGDIFDETPDSGAEQGADQVSYLVMGFQGSCMKVAELGGQNRDNRVVLAKDIPAPGTFKKWRFNKRLEGLREDYAHNALAVIRESLSDLRVVESFEDVHVTFNDSNVDERGQGNFTAYVRLGDEGLFRQVAYDFGRGKSVCPVLRHFDIDRLGVIPDRYRVKGDPRAYTADIWSLALDQRGADAIKALAEGHGILMFPDSYIGYPVIPQSYRDRAVSEIQGYIPGEGDRAKHFMDIKTAHQAVQELHGRTITAS